MKRVVVMGRSTDFSDRPYDGFSKRHARFILELNTSLDVHLLVVRQESDPADLPNPTLASIPLLEVHMPARRHSRSRVLLGWSPEPGFSEQVATHLALIDPDAVVTLGPWLDEEYAAAFERYPTVHVFEEDLTQMRELFSQSLQGRALRRVGHIVRRLRVPIPNSVVVISQAELHRARRRYGSKPTYTVVPQTLDETWTPSDVRSQGNDLLCLGVLSELRNAEALMPFIRTLAARELPSELQLRLVSATGLHPLLADALLLPWIHHDSTVEEPVRAYRNARMALVPAARATGVKATILQAWSSGCPVAALEGSAKTVGARHQSAMLVGETPERLVDLVLGAWSKPDLLDDLVRGGREAMSSDFDDALALRSWRRLVAAIAYGH